MGRVNGPAGTRVAFLSFTDKNVGGKVVYPPGRESSRSTAPDVPVSKLIQVRHLRTPAAKSSKFTGFGKGWHTPCPSVKSLPYARAQHIDPSRTPLSAIAQRVAS